MDFEILQKGEGQPYSWILVPTRSDMDGDGTLYVFLALPEILERCEDARSFVLCPATGVEV
jgi:hypothetical protein